MTITVNTTVAQLASAIPGSVRVFQRHGIDFCCGGKVPLSTACQQKGLSFADVSGEIETLAAHPDGTERDWQSEPLDVLTDHIVQTYHDPLREELRRLEAMAAKVRNVHGGTAQYLVRLDAIVRELSADLRSHMQKEEQVLFPAIRAIHAGADGARPISTPISVMEHEHDQAGALLAELRSLTADYTAPEWACGTFRALYHGLNELESTMHVHVHLENNVLFPRARRSVPMPL